MKGFFSALWDNLSGLPGNLRRGLRPGVADSGNSAASRLRRSFVYHIHPLRVTRRALRASTTLGLGVVSLTAFLILGVTGVLLMIYYQPGTQQAYASMQDIQYAVALGPFVRALHRWAAYAMLVSILLHLLRVASMGAYRGRELNWLVGLGLGGLALGLAFTGYLLPWDQRSYWAVRVSASMLDSVPLFGLALKNLMLGGQTVGQAALLRFYMLHVAMLPAGMLALIAIHLWRIRRDGGLAKEAGEGEDNELVPAWPHLVLRETLLMLWVLVALSAIAALVSAPLGAPVDVHIPANPEKAPWYFLWAQELVSYSARLGAFVIPALLVLGLVGLPFLDREDKGVGRWFGTPACRLAVLLSGLGAIGALLAFEVLYMQAGPGVFFKALGTLWPDIVNPGSGMIVVAFIAAISSGIATGSTRAAFLSGLVVMLVMLLGFTLIGVCRGPDWVFYWPWEGWPGVS
jgi:quinol-cytochrome oxidoreductase complex cytochrome b subunit